MRKNILFIAFSFLVFTVSAQNPLSDAYTGFPTKADWEKIWAGDQHDVHERVMEAMQVPDDVLAKMSTKGLLETCMLYPANTWIFTDPQGDYMRSYRWYMQRSNAYQEYFKRKDAAKVALDTYQKFDYASADDVFVAKKDKNPMEFVEYHTKALCLGLLLGQEEMLSKMNADQKKQAVKIGLLKAADIQESEVFGGVSRGAIFYPIPAILDREQFADMESLKSDNADIEGYISTGQLGSRDDLQSILEKGQKFINESN